MFPNASRALCSICDIKRIYSQRDNLNRSERVSATFFHAMCHSAAAMLPGEKYTGGEIQIYLVTSSNKKGKNSALFVNYTTANSSAHYVRNTCKRLYNYYFFREPLANTVGRPKKIC